jgi:hypothetical protein
MIKPTLPMIRIKIYIFAPPVKSLNGSKRYIKSMMTSRQHGSMNVRHAPECPFQDQCVKAKSGKRTVTRTENDPIREEMRTKVQSDDGKASANFTSEEKTK